MKSHEPAALSVSCKRRDQSRRILAAASLFFGLSSLPFQTALSQTPTVTYNLATESDAGMDGGISWQSVFLLNDGRIASFGTGNHAPNQSNAMRIIDPVTSPGTVQSYDMFPWTQTSSPSNYDSGTNRFVSNYDNHASIYIPSENKAIWINHGVFDFGQRTWVYGDREPLTQGYQSFLDDATAGPMTGVYNPAVAWCKTIDKGVWFANSSGGYGRSNDDLTVVERSPQGSSKPWRLTKTAMGSQGVAGLHYARNTAVCIGDQFYVAGPRVDGSGNAFYRINISNRTLSATLTPMPAVSGDYFPQMVHDTVRNKLVVLGVRVLEYDIQSNAWTDITPSGWAGYESVGGVYHEGLNAIFFRGQPKNSTTYSAQFRWHRMSFSGTSPPPAGDTQAPTVPAGVTGAAQSTTRVNVSWTASTDNVAVAGYRVYRDGTQIGTSNTTSYADTAAVAATTYSYRVASYDTTVNVSAQSSAVSVTTQAAAPTPPPSSPSGQYRLINVDPNFNPFLGPPDRDYGGSKHVYLGWHPVNKRVYSFGGDYGNGAQSFGQPGMGDTFTAGSGRSYQRDSSLNMDQYSIDPYATGTNRWRLEHPYLPRNINGQRESRPGRPDQASLVWDSSRNKLWGIITAIRSEFLYKMPDGSPDLWANGDMTTTGQPEETGTWSFVPNASGGAGTWTLETSARVVFRSGSPTVYEGSALYSGQIDERVAYWEYDPQTDRMMGFGSGRIFIFNPATKTYEHRTWNTGAYGYLSAASSQVAIVGDWMYGVAMARQGSAQKSLMVRINIKNMLALANGAAIPDSSANWEAVTLPWSLSAGSVWETNGDGYAKWQEHAGVMAIGGKVVLVASYDRLVDNGVTKLSIWDPATRAFTAAPAPPETDIAANSWVALPDSGEVLFGLNTSGYTNTKMWAFKVASTPTSGTAPRPPTNVAAQ
ncbi:MAG TPA: hypothetical protein VK629_19825 [Steroidobacteraceae bacterium]|nr:hypothetical protein [Steroidobacteraceae bacterium]